MVSKLINQNSGTMARMQRARKGDPLKPKNTYQLNNSSNASSSRKHSFFGYFLEDPIKTLWKILSGATISGIQKNILKDKDFSINFVIDKVFRRDFISRFGADLLGAWSVRLFDGKAKVLGVEIPKINSAISSQLGPASFAKFWRAISLEDDLNKISASNEKNEFKEKFKESIQDKTWYRLVKKVSAFYKNQISPSLTKVLSFVFGIKPVEGKEPEIDWKRFFGVTLASGIFTYMLPKDTQVFGMESISESKGFTQSLLASAATFLVTIMSRLENYLFRFSLSLHQEGYGFDGVMKVAVRDKLLTPIVQTFADVISPHLSNLVPANGAFVSSLIRLPLEMLAGFMSSGLTGISKETRVPDYWIYLSNRIWKPVANFIEKIFIGSSFSFPYKFPLLPIYRFFGFYSKEYDHSYLEPKERKLSPKIEQKYSEIGISKLFLSSVLKIPNDLKKLWLESK